MKKPVQKPKGSVLSSMSERDRKLLMLFPVIIGVALMAILGIKYSQSIDAIEAETQRHRAALDYLSQEVPAYLERQSGVKVARSHKEMTEEQLKTNDIKLTSFVAEHASKAEITITSYDEDEMPFGGSAKGEGPIITERQLRIEIREAEMAKLLDLLDRIEKSDQPVFIKRLDIRDVRAKGSVRAIVTVSTFIQKEKAT
jgi:hypothetical protein